MNAKFIDRKLGERSHLKFEFPQAGGDVPLVVFLPFFENVDIRETKKANISEQSPISRSSSILTYTGAKARRFKLTFNLTLPHLMEQYMNLDRYLSTVVVGNRETERAKFFNPILNQSESSLGSAEALEKEYIKSLMEHPGETFVNVLLRNNPHLNGEQINTIIHLYDDAARPSATRQVLDNFVNSTLSFLDLNSITSVKPAAVKRERRAIINVISYWVNLIRSSCYNNAKDPTLGPPIVRLFHGILFRDVPCVCSDYSVGFDDDAGMDVQTLLSRKIKVSMTLIEARHGNFSSFRPGEYTTRDNLAGWESVISSDATLDPQTILGGL